MSLLCHMYSTVFKKNPIERSAAADDDDYDDDDDDDDVSQ